jgi:hypothetical protein
MNVEYDTKRTPSNCDRIIYRGDINVSNYDVYLDNYLIRQSDHLLVYGEFIYNNKNSIIFTWNMGGLILKDINNGLDKLVKDFNLLNYDLIIFCLQESTDTDLFPELIVERLKEFRISIATSHSLGKKFNVRLLVFDKTIGIKSSDIKLNPNASLDECLHPSLIIRTANLETNPFKLIFNNKSLVSIKIDGLTILSCHLPIDTKLKDLGNQRRIKAIRKIKLMFKDESNLLIAGDLNFRIVDNKDQLTTYLKNQTCLNMIEFTPELKIKTCKIKKLV